MSDLSDENQQPLVAMHLRCGKCKQIKEISMTQKDADMLKKSPARDKEGIICGVRVMLPDDGEEAAISGVIGLLCGRCGKAITAGRMQT